MHFCQHLTRLQNWQFSLLSTVDRNYSLESSWVWRYKQGTPVCWEFLQIFSAYPLKVCQVGWGALLHHYFHVSPEMFDWVQVHFLALKETWVPKSFSCIVLAVCLWLLSCWKMNLPTVLGSESSGAGFHQRSLFYYAPFIFASILTSLPVSAAEKHPHSMMAATTMLHRRDGARFPPDVTLGIQTKEFNLGFIRAENLVSHVLRVFSCLLANSKRTVMCLLLRSGFRLATLP